MNLLCLFGHDKQRLPAPKGYSDLVPPWQCRRCPAHWHGWQLPPAPPMPTAKPTPPPGRILGEGENPNRGRA